MIHGDYIKNYWMFSRSFRPVDSMLRQPNATTLRLQHTEAGNYHTVGRTYEHYEEIPNLRSAAYTPAPVCAVSKWFHLSTFIVNFCFIPIIQIINKKSESSSFENRSGNSRSLDGHSPAWFYSETSAHVPTPTTPTRRLRYEYIICTHQTS